MLSAGNRIGPYEIVAAIGAGGMGEVYRARDPRLGRDVAIKVLPDALALDSERLARFEREARVVAGLSHAGIASIFGAEGEGYEMAGTVSPDGKWLAYVTNKTGREEVCLRRLEGSGGSWQLSNNQGGGVRWGRDGREIFFVTGETLVRVPLTVRGDDLSIGQPEALFDVPPTPLESTVRDYDYDPANDRFLFTRPPRGVGERREIALSLGWAERLRSRLSEIQGARR